MYAPSSILALTVLLQALPSISAAPVPSPSDIWAGGYGNANGIDNIGNTQLDRREPILPRQDIGGVGNANGVGNFGNVQLDRRELASSEDAGVEDIDVVDDFDLNDLSQWS